MRTVVLETLLKLLVPLFLLIALYVFLRGHDHPGGGFIGGLISVIPLMVHAIAFSAKKTRTTYKVRPFFIVSVGLLLAVLSGVFPMITGAPFLTALWSEYPVPVIGKTGTPTLFDAGVFLVVAGVVLQVTFLLTKDE